ncbi:MAG: diaminopimelate epimerase [Oscillospiraceae bacterium]|nr:diaminopimelate epimerase [Oscillospiraceae bacterium]
MKYWHMSGAGNDFMVMDARDGDFDFQALSKSLCAAYGTDGFMALDRSEKADFRLHFYNSDGTRGEMCGNGARCICKFAYDHGIAGEEMSVETDAGIVYGWRLGAEHYRVQLNNPGLVNLTCRENGAYVELGDPGVPHSVTHWPGLQWEDRQALLPEFLVYRNAPEYPKGVNVNFYTWVGETTIRILTFERGVEDYTLACGTGSASTAVVLWLTGHFPGGKLTVLNPGGKLEVTVEGANGIVHRLFLEGPATVLNVLEL